MEGKNLITVRRGQHNSFRFQLTGLGDERATTLGKSKQFEQICGQMRDVKSQFGSMTGSSLRKLVYDIFEKEVAQKQLGQVIT